MRALLLTDGMFALRERPLLERLRVGLLDEGVHVLLAIPHRLVGRASFDLMGAPIGYNDSGLGLSRRIRARQLTRALPAPDKKTGRAVDVIHVFGGSAWKLGAELARMTESSLILEIWRNGLVERARSFRAGEAVWPAFLAPDKTIERALLREGGGSVRLAPWGAAAPPEPVPILREGRVWSLIMIGGGRDAAACRACFEGLARVASARDDVMIFVDADAARRARLWKLAESLGVLSATSLIDEMEDRRDLVLRGDIIVQSDSRHEQRTLLLDAMAAGLAVVASKDEDVSVLIDRRTALLVEGNNASAWAESMSELLADPESARSLGRAARQYVRQTHRPSAYAGAVLDAYEWVVSGGAMPFKAQAG